MSEPGNVKNVCKCDSLRILNATHCTRPEILIISTLSVSIRYLINVTVVY